MEKELQVPIVQFAEFEVLFNIDSYLKWLTLFNTNKFFKRSLRWISSEGFLLIDPMSLSKIRSISICYDFGTRIAPKFFAFL